MVDNPYKYGGIMVFKKIFGEIPDNVKIYERQAVKAVIFKDNKLLMVKTNKGDYKFPGGGKESGETDSKTVIREVREETGYQIDSVKQMIGTVLQQNHDIYDNDSYFRMISLYYICTIADNLTCEQKLDKYEEEQKFTVEFVTLDDAIDINEQLLKSKRDDINSWVERETYILRKLQEKITHVYFVRHAQPQHDWKEDISCPLTDEGMMDTRKVDETMHDIHLDFAMCSPYKRSMDTIAECVTHHNLELHTDIRFRERESGENGNVQGMFQKRWLDFSFHEDGGESLSMVQKRNIEALHDLLNVHTGENLILGTHGTALSTIMNYYYPTFNCNSFLRMIDYMPYIIRLDFIGIECIGSEELLIIEKKFIGKNISK